MGLKFGSVQLYIHYGNCHQVTDGMFSPRPTCMMNTNGHRNMEQQIGQFKRMGQEESVFEKTSNPALQADKGGQTSESWLPPSRGSHSQITIAVPIVPVSTLRCEPVEL